MQQYSIVVFIIMWYPGSFDIDLEFNFPK